MQQYYFLPESQISVPQCLPCPTFLQLQQIQQMHYSFHSTPTCTFKSRHQTVTKQNQLASMPGPADYQAKKPLPQVGTVAQSSQARNLYKTFQANPGPGTYEPKSYISDGQKRSMSQRFLQPRKHTPGPMDYEIKPAKVLNQSPVFSLGNKSKSARDIIFDHNSFKPAPTNYNTRVDLINKHGVVIGSADRKDLTQTEKTPAPNHYMSATAHNFASVANPRCKIGEETRKNEFMQSQNTPGPAFYSKSSFVEENGSKKKGFSCRQRVDNLIAQEISKFPAPGHYQVHTKHKNQAPQYTTTLTKRHTFMDDTQSFRKEFPGPGTHDPAFTGTKYRSLSANSFAKDVRKALDENEKTPGPAEYNHQKKAVLNTAPKFSSTKTVAKNEFLQVNPENPGPGQYDPNQSLIKPKLLISQVPKEDRPGFEKHRHTPGPGFYNLRGKEEGPTWRFPSQKRISFTDRKNEAKDGVHYEIASKVVDPPTYMRVNSKISLSPSKSMRQTGLSGR